MLLLFFIVVNWIVVIVVVFLLLGLFLLLVLFKFSSFVGLQLNVLTLKCAADLQVDLLCSALISGPSLP